MKYLKKDNEKYYFSLSSIDTFVEMIGGKRIDPIPEDMYSLDDPEHKGETIVRCFVFDNAEDNYFMLSEEDKNQLEDEIKILSKKKSPYNNIYLLIYETDNLGKCGYGLTMANGMATKLWYFARIITSSYNSIDEMTYNYFECLKHIIFDK